MDPADEIARLRIENEELRAKLIVAKGSRSAPSIGGYWRGLSPAEQEARARAHAADIAAKALALGFDVSTEQGRSAYFAMLYREARGEPEPPIEPAAEKFRAGTFSEPAVRQHTFEEVTATPAAILRSLEKAEGKVVDWPADETARAILRADARARNEPEPGDKPL